jgi:hypothetical protein
MRHRVLYCAAVLLLAGLSTRANGSIYDFNFTGPGVSGNLALTYGTAADSKYPQALEVTGISGYITDTNIGIVNAAVTGLVPINHASPDPTNNLAPNDFSKFPVALGTMDGSLSYDNLFYPNGSPQTAPLTDYPFHGGFLDIYGLLFDISGGDVVNLWSNGVLPGATYSDYGIAVATSATTLDYVSNGVVPTPEPSSWCMLGTGLLVLLLGRRSRLLWTNS